MSLDKAQDRSAYISEIDLRSADCNFIADLCTVNRVLGSDSAHLHRRWERDSPAAAMASGSGRIAEKGRFKIFKAMMIIGERSSDLSLSLFELV